MFTHSFYFKQRNKTKQKKEWEALIQVTILLETYTHGQNIKEPQQKEPQH